MDKNREQPSWIEAPYQLEVDEALVTIWSCDEPLGQLEHLDDPKKLRMDVPVHFDTRDDYVCQDYWYSPYRQDREVADDKFAWLKGRNLVESKIKLSIILRVKG